jgi:serine/threonine-protein kinase
MWRADIVGSEFRGGCLAVWNLMGEYPSNGRGDGCTSADAAGFPIAPLLADADEVAGGEVGHALRFILPNSRIRDQVYLHPATHSTGATSGGPDAPPYGARFRLRADYPVESLPSEGARVLARALQRYGMFLSDGGNIALTVRSDRSTGAAWAGLLGPHDLRDLQVGDFEMVDGGTRFVWDGDCTRLPMPQLHSCSDGVDNDDDGRTDQADPQCAGGVGLSEARSSACGLGFELAPVLGALLARRRTRGRRAARARAR